MTGLQAVFFAAHSLKFCCAHAFACKLRKTFIRVGFFHFVACVFPFWWRWRLRERMENVRKTGNNRHYFYDILWILIATWYWERAERVSVSFPLPQSIIVYQSLVHSLNLFFSAFIVHACEHISNIREHRTKWLFSVAFFLIPSQNHKVSAEKSNFYQFRWLIAIKV